MWFVSIWKVCVSVCTQVRIDINCMLILPGHVELISRCFISISYLQVFVRARDGGQELCSWLLPKGKQLLPVRCQPDGDHGLLLPGKIHWQCLLLCIPSIEKSAAFMSIIDKCNVIITILAFCRSWLTWLYFHNVLVRVMHSYISVRTRTSRDSYTRSEKKVDVSNVLYAG